MRIKFLYTLLSITLLLFFQACGSNSSSTDKSNTILSEANYMALAKYHYSRISSELKKRDIIEDNNNQKFRSYPGAKESDLSDIGRLKITAVTPFNKYIESMRISVDNQLIDVKVKNRLYAVISLYENGVLVKSSTQTLDEFTKFDLFDEGAL